MSAGDFFQGKAVKRNLVSLENGAVSASTFSAVPIMRVESAPPTHSFTAPPPEPATRMPQTTKSESLPLPSFPTSEPLRSPAATSMTPSISEAPSSVEMSTDYGTADSVGLFAYFSRASVYS